MKTRNCIALADKCDDLSTYFAKDLREELIGLRDLVRMLLRNAPDDFDMGIAEVMKKTFVLDWIIEEMEMKDMELPEE